MTTPPCILYLHGFISSPGSAKARLFSAYAAGLPRPPRVLLPALPEEPGRALAAAEGALLAALREGCAPLGLVGSSMGGFYATVLAERYDLRAVLVNPAVRPHRHLAARLGEHINPYSGRRFTLDQSHVDELAAMAPARIDPRRYWLLAQTGDEVLDYREAESFYAGARQTIEPGGDHHFQNFGGHLPAILNFLQCAAE